MRIRTANAIVHKASGLDRLFDRAQDRHVAWLVGSDHVYSDLERVAKKYGYRVFVPEDEAPEFWYAVRMDLVADSSWDPAKTQVRFEPSREQLGPVLLNDDPDFNFGDRVKSDQLSDMREYDGFSYGERLLTVSPSKD